MKLSTSCYPTADVRRAQAANAQQSALREFSHRAVAVANTKKDVRDGTMQYRNLLSYLGN